MSVYLVGYAKHVLYSEQPTVSLAWRHLNTMLLTKFKKFKFHFEHFPRNTRDLSFDRSTYYLYLFTNHRQIFSWRGERSSSQLKVTKMWFGANIKYLSEPFFADFCYQEATSCYFLDTYTISRRSRLEAFYKKAVVNSLV